MDRQVRVAACSPSPAVLAGLGAVLTATPGVIFRAARSRRELGQLHRVDVLVWHIERSAQQGPAPLPDHATSPLVAAVDDSKVDGVDVIHMLRRGFISAVSLTTDLPRLPQTCWDAADGQAYLSPRLVAMIVSHYNSGRTVGSAAAGFGLTARETQVLEHLATGDSLRAIARKLMIEERTVRHHLQQIFRKLNVTSRYQAVALAYREGLAA